jgi:hypothetical protein
MFELHGDQNVIVYLFSPRIMFMVDVLKYSVASRIEFVFCLFYYLFKILAGLPDIFLYIPCGPKRKGILASVANHGEKGNRCQGLETDPKLRLASCPQGRIHSSITHLLSSSCSSTLLLRVLGRVDSGTCKFRGDPTPLLFEESGAFTIPSFVGG